MQKLKITKNINFKGWKESCLSLLAASTKGSPAAQGTIFGCGLGDGLCSLTLASLGTSPATILSPKVFFLFLLSFLYLPPTPPPSPTFFLVFFLRSWPIISLVLLIQSIFIYPLKNQAFISCNFFYCYILIEPNIQKKNSVLFLFFFFVISLV
jgi:hypothetical protein